MLKPYTKRFENYSLPQFPTTCEELYSDITNHFKDLCDVRFIFTNTLFYLNIYNLQVWYLHILSSIRSSFSYTVVAGSILPSKQGMQLIN